MDPIIFQQFKEIVYKNCGISLNESKVAMVSSRIAKRMRILNINDHSAYLDYLIEDKSGEEITKFLDVISTNVTSFFRESEHFDLLEQIITEIVESGQKKIRIWCAASSTGEEPFTIAMVSNIITAGKSIDLKILATDISTKVLADAKNGRYAVDKIKTIPKNLIIEYFSKQTAGDKIFFQVKDVLKRLVVFKRLNLFKPPFPMKGPLDVVFCRNVMIYFDNQTRSRLVSEIYRLLKPGGYLITGHAESLTSVKNDFKCVKPSVFQK